jgi:hypothetical protein
MGSRGDKRMIEIEIIMESKCVSPWQHAPKSALVYKRSLDWGLVLFQSDEKKL